MNPDVSNQLYTVCNYENEGYETNICSVCRVKNKDFYSREVYKCAHIPKYLCICIYPPHSSHESPELLAYNTWQNCDPNK